MNKIRAIFQLLLCDSFFIYTRSGLTSWVHKKNIALPDADILVYESEEIHSDLFESEHAVAITNEILNR
jgi:hypothetical protein